MRTRLEVLEDLGIETARTPEGFPVDLRGSGFAIEVTGISKAITVSSEKYNQTLRFLETHSKGEKILVVANTFKNTEPSRRPSQSFSKVVSDSLKLHHVCLVTTLNLYLVWKAVREGSFPKKDAVRLLKASDGVLQWTAIR